MKQVLIFLLSAASFFGKTKGAGCPTSWASFKGSCYEFFSDKEAWTQANYICEEHQGHLVTITTAQENDYVTSLIKSKQVHRDRVWIGANDMMTEGHFSWIATNEHINYSNWSPSQPSNAHGDENCVNIMAESNYLWNDDLCTKRLNYVCERGMDGLVG